MATTRNQRATGGAVHGTPAGADPFDPDDPGPYPVHGLALPSDALTYGKDEEWTYWPDPVVRATEGKVDGRNLVEGHPKEPSPRDVIGAITREQYIPDVGLAWEGELDDRELAKSVYRGRLDSSPYLKANDGGDAELPADAPEETRIASEVIAVRDIGLVADGAIPDAAAGAGSHPEMGEQSSENVAKALSSAFGESRGGSVNPDDPETGHMSDSQTGGDGPNVERLQSRIAELEDENAELENQVQTLREPYVEVVTRGTNLEPDDVNLSPEQLAERIANLEDDDDQGDDDDDDGQDDGQDDDGETALSAAPLTATAGSPPGSSSSSGDGNGRVTALSSGSSGASGQLPADVEEPDQDLETLKKRRQLMGSRVTEEHREKLDKQIEYLENGGGN